MKLNFSSRFIPGYGRVIIAKYLDKDFAFISDNRVTFSNDVVVNQNFLETINLVAKNFWQLVDSFKEE